MRKYSLLSKYLLLIIVAIGIFPLTMILVSLLIYEPILLMDKDMANKYQNGTELEAWWHDEASKLTNASPTKINDRLAKLHKEYDKASMFWVDSNGKTRGKIPSDAQIPDTWSASYTVSFMKENRGLDNERYTIVAFIGGSPDESHGFMVFQVPRKEMLSTGELLQDKYGNIVIILMGIILLLFIVGSVLFFVRIRRRLMHLQLAMASPNEKGLPTPIKVKNKDEIGQLEETFNHMIVQLEDSKRREQEEEALRKQLIANLSHDLRTPLTTIRAHAYGLQKESLSSPGKDSLQLIESKIAYLDKLIENLLSYTLLSAGKYTYHPERLDIARKVRTAIAAWYPVFEEAGFMIDINLPEKQITWMVDGQWFERIMDNLFQNVHRHAKSGKYISVNIENYHGAYAIVIKDKGPGISGASDNKGIGIGLAIVSLMLKEMKLEWKIDSSSTGTTIIIHNGKIEPLDLENHL